MNNDNFKSHVRGAPPKPAWKKRVDVETKTTARKTVVKPIKRLQSPVKGETTPEWCVYFHAREKNGKPMLSCTQSISAVKFGEVLALWILDNHNKLHFHPVALAWGVLKAVAASWEQATGEKFALEGEEVPETEMKKDERK